MKFHILILTILFQLSVNTYANQNIKKAGSITGSIFDKKTDNPIEYATISIYSAADNQLIDGTITNEQGIFIIKKITPGKYTIRISFMGYKTTEISDVTISDSNLNITLKKTYIESENTKLDEVEVYGKSNQIDYKIDKKIISVGENQAMSSLTAVDVLENMPSIKVGIDGNVSLRGNSGFTVLIDGKPTVLDANDVLSQMPASSIKSIELITNPSAKYQPDGTGGIINIITKKSTTNGWTGIANIKGGNYNLFGGDFLFTYKKNKFSIYCGADYSSLPRPSDSYSRRITTANDSITTLIQKGKNESTRQRVNIKTGFDWAFSDKDIFSAEGSIGFFEMNSNADMDINTTTNFNSLETIELNKNKSFRRGDYYKLSGVYTRKFNEKAQLTSQANYRYLNSDEASENKIYLEDIFNTGSKTTEKGPSKRLDANIDFSYDFSKKTKFETGTQARIGDITDITGVLYADSINNNFIEQNDKSNNFKYNRAIYAVYATFNSTKDLFGYQLGLRSELTDRTISSNSTNEKYKTQILDFFPTLHLSYRISENNQLMTSYSRRVDRPKGYYLEPFLTWTDMYSVRKGNPEILPEYIDAFELSFINKRKKSDFTAELYYHIKHNKIERKNSLYNENVVLTEFSNVGTDYSLGLELMEKIDLFKWWNITILGNVYHYTINGSDNSKSSNNWSMRVNNSFLITSFLRFQLDANYDSPTVTSQGKEYEMYSVNSAIKGDFMERKLSISLQVRDIFATQNHTSYTDTDSFYLYSEHNSMGPYFVATISYKFNNYKVKREKEKSDNDGEDF